MKRMGVNPNSIFQNDTQPKGSGQAGTVPADKASTPVVTRDGSPKIKDGSGAANFVRDPRGSNPTSAGSRDFVRENGPPRGTGGQPPASSDVTAGMRRQTPTTAAQRLGGEKNLPQNGQVDVPVPNASAWRQGAGSIGNDRRPFKLGK